MFEKNVYGTAEKLSRTTVAIAGCGGVGSNAAVALARAGVGNLIIADFDYVEESNLNRQYYFQSDIGKPKIECLALHLKNINPEIQLKASNKILEPCDVQPLFEKVDILIEAFDRAENKQWLIETWCKEFPEKPIICASGLAGVGKTEALKVKKSGNIYFCGDQESDESIGLISSRVAIVANMQANLAIEILLKKNADN